MRYLHTDPTSAAGRLIPKRRAPKCHNCGRVLWTATPVTIAFSIHNAKGERLGYVPLHRYAFSVLFRLDSPLLCWNGKACDKRKETDDG